MEKNLEKAREKIDKLDMEFLKLLSKRINIVNDVGKIKKQLNLSTYDKQRETYTTVIF